LLDIFCCKARCREKVDQDLYDYLSHRKDGRNLGIDAEASEKGFDRFEKIDNGIVACANIV
jgi:hypothetical protein